MKYLCLWLFLGVMTTTCSKSSTGDQLQPGDYPGDATGTMDGQDWTAKSYAQSNGDRVDIFFDTFLGQDDLHTTRLVFMNIPIEVSEFELRNTTSTSVPTAEYFILDGGSDAIGSTYYLSTLPEDRHVLKIENIDGKKITGSCSLKFALFEGNSDAKKELQLTNVTFTTELDD